MLILGESQVREWFFAFKDIPIDKKTILIGDRISDIEAGLNAKIISYFT